MLSDKMTVVMAMTMTRRVMTRRVAPMKGMTTRTAIVVRDPTTVLGVLFSFFGVAGEEVVPLSALAADNWGDDDEDEEDDGDFDEDEAGLDGDHDLEEEADEAEAEYQQQVAATGKRSREGAAAGGQGGSKRTAR
jgi:hypothetical protein